MGGKKWPSEHLCVCFLVCVCVCPSECVFVCIRVHVFPHVYEHACVRVWIHAVCMCGYTLCACGDSWLLLGVLVTLPLYTEARPLR